LSLQTVNVAPPSAVLMTVKPAKPNELLDLGFACSRDSQLRRTGA
jgi:hypothetical protein